MNYAIVYQSLISSRLKYVEGAPKRSPAMSREGTTCHGVAR